VIGVPFHVELLNATDPGPALPQFIRMTTGGELVRSTVHDRFTGRFGAHLGIMYGMTEMGVIATDLFGQHYPALAPAPGMSLRVADGELLVRSPATPYVGLADPARWADGWLHTKDAATIDQAGRVTIRGRLDSQISVGGLKVDLMEVEQTLAGLPGVAEAVVSYDGAIEAYVVVQDATTIAEIDQALARRLAPYKRPRRVLAVDAMPHTPTGKLIRDRAALAIAARGVATPHSSVSD
jgi:acyl-coenzyme A synthetase/AMP-(fatty) acid ligase